MWTPLRLSNKLNTSIVLYSFVSKEVWRKIDDRQKPPAICRSTNDPLTAYSQLSRPIRKPTANPSRHLFSNERRCGNERQYLTRFACFFFSKRDILAWGLYRVWLGPHCERRRIYLHLTSERREHEWYDQELAGYDDYVFCAGSVALDWLLYCKWKIRLYFLSTISLIVL